MNDNEKDLCKVGDTIYRLTRSGVEPIVVTEINHYPHTVYKGEEKHTSYFNRSFGKTIFLTEEEAYDAQARRERISEKKQKLREYEEVLNKELKLEGHFIVK